MKLVAGIAAAFALVVGFVSVVLGGHHSPSGPELVSYGRGLRPGSVPPEFEQAILAAAQTCTEVTAPLLAAQIEAESNFKVDAVSNRGALGPAQFMPGTWATYGVDADGDGKEDPRSPADAVMAQAKYMCRLVDLVRPLGGATIDFALAAYNAGEGRILGCKCIPHNGQTEFYVPKIKAAMAKYTSSDDVVAATGGWIKPVARAYTVGAVFHQSGPLWSLGWHTGYDYVVPSGTDVLATYNGTVTSAGWAGAYGWHIVLDHGSGVQSTYSHLSELGVHAGDKVQTGQRIGLSGNTGNTTGPHLHFEIKVNGGFVDPVAWLNSHAGSSDTAQGAAAAAIAAARRQLGVPYVFGGGSLTGPSPAAGAGTAGFDCSSLTRYAWYTATAGSIELPRVADDQYGATQAVTGSLQPGDLIFYKTGRLSGRWDHVGMYLGNGQMIHAPRPGKTVEIIDITSGYYQQTPHEARRVTK